MKLCLKDKSNLKWVIIAVVASLLLYSVLEEDQVELAGDILVLAGGVLIVLSD